MTAYDWYKIVSDDTPLPTAIGVVLAAVVGAAVALWRLVRR